MRASIIIWTAMLASVMPQQLAIEETSDVAYSECEEMDANLTVVEAYPTSLALQWQDDVNLVERCKIQLKLQYGQGDPIICDCLSAYEDTAMIPTCDTRRNLFLPNIRKETRKTLKDRTSSKADELESVRQKTPGTLLGDYQARKSTSAIDEGKVVRRFILPGLEPCQVYALNLLIVPVVSDPNCNSSYIYTDEIRNAATTVDDSIPPVSLLCSVTQDVLSLNWSQPIETCDVDYYRVSWNGTSLWSDDSMANSSTVNDLEFSLSPTLVYAKYDFQVAAFYEEYNISSVPAQTTCETLQKESSAPQNVTVLESQSSFITIGWDPPSAANGEIEGYQIDYRQNSSEEISSLNTSTTSGNVSGLDECTDYEFRVWAVNGAGLGNASDTTVGSTIGQENPQLELACTSEEFNISISWNTIYVNCTETQYSVQYNYTVNWRNESKSSEAKSVNQENFFTVPIEDTIPGTRYDFEVTTESGLSALCSLITDEAKSNAPEIKNLSSTPSSIYIEWFEPTEANGVVTTYDVSYVEQNCSACERQFLAVEETFTNITEGIEPCSQYEVEVSAINLAGSGDPAAEEIVTGYSGPTSTSCTAESESEILVVWGASGKCASSGYDLLWNGTSLWEPDATSDGSVSVNGSLSEYHLDDLHPYSLYTICLHNDRAQEDVCCNCTTLEGKSDAPTITGTDATSASIYVTWSPPVDARGIITNYNITYVAEETRTSFSVLVNGETHEENVTENIEACTTYRVEVAPINGYGSGDVDAADVETAFEGVSDVSCEAESSSEVLVFWTASGDCYAAGYPFTWQGESLWENDVVFNDSSLVNGSADAFWLTGLHPYTKYEICLEGNSEADADVCCECTTDEAAPTEPQFLSFTDVTTNSMTLKWQEPKSWNGRQLGYILACAGDLENTTHTQVVLTDLEIDTTYNVSVVACSGGGCSPPANDEGSTKTEDKTALIVSVSVVTVGIALTLVIVIVITLKKKRQAPISPEDTVNSNDEFNFESFEEKNFEAMKKAWSEEDIVDTLRF